MKDFDENVQMSSFSRNERQYVEDLLEEKDRLLDVARRDMQSLKREIVELKKELNYSRTKKK